MSFTAEDDKFHFGQMGDRWWMTETSWFSFCHPGRKLGGWLYTMARPNIGTVAGGAWVWDDDAHLPWEVAYSANYTALRLPRDQELTDIALPTGVSLRMVEPCTRYELGFQDGERCRIDRLAVRRHHAATPSAQGRLALRRRQPLRPVRPCDG